MGPEGGVKGGEVVAEGTPEKVAQNPRSFTGAYLKPMLEKEQAAAERSEEHTSELQSLMRTSYAVFCLKKNNRLRTAPKARKASDDNAPSHYTQSSKNRRSAHNAL